MNKILQSTRYFRSIRTQGVYYKISDSMYFLCWEGKIFFCFYLLSNSICLFFGTIAQWTRQTLFQVLGATAKRKETVILNIQLISWGANTTLCSLLNANLTILSTTHTTCKTDHHRLPDPEDTLAYSQFSNLSAQQCKTLLFTNVHFSFGSVCWLWKFYIVDLNSALPPWL